VSPVSKALNAAKSLGGAAVVACCVAFTPIWEGMDHVAKKDMIGTGHPVTYCYGQTDEFGTVKVGTKFTKQECDEKLAESLPKYLDKVGQCVTRPVPVKTMSSLVDASYNAGPTAVCRSPMVAKINAGDIKGGCEAFKGWYVRSDGQVRKGLVARRSGIDSRKSEMELCLEGANDPKSEMYVYASVEALTAATPVAVHKPVVVHKHHMLKPHVVVCAGALFWRECK
jgi:lysozyme